MNATDERVHKFILEQELTNLLLTREPKEPVPDREEATLWLEFGASKEERNITYQKAMLTGQPAGVVAMGIYRYIRNVEESCLAAMLAELDEILEIGKPHQDL